jgi:hypothetical protein
MFERICIKPKELTNQLFDISSLIEAMLFYGKVILLVRRNELVILLKAFGVDFFEALIKSGRVELHIGENILGSMGFPVGGEEKYNIDLFSKQNEDYSSILYQAHREIVNNSSQNLRFSNTFSKIAQPFRYEQGITDQIRNDFGNKEFLKSALPIYISSIVPQYEAPKEIKVDIVKDSSFGQFEAYSLNSNLNLEIINKILQQNNPDGFHPIGYGGFFLSIAEAKGDIYIASHFDSELVTSDLYSKFINLEFSELIQRRTKSLENVLIFKEHILTDCYSIGEAYINHSVSNTELLELLQKADKFRNWLQNVQSDKSLVGEYYRAVTEKTFAEKLPVNIARFIILEGIGITIDFLGAGGLGTAIGTGLSAFNEFYLDKLIKGWKPNQFIDDKLKPMIKK